MLYSKAANRQPKNLYNLKLLLLEQLSIILVVATFLIVSRSFFEKKSVVITPNPLVLLRQGRFQNDRSRMDGDGIRTGKKDQKYLISSCNLIFIFRQNMHWILEKYLLVVYSLMIKINSFPKLAMPPI